MKTITIPRLQAFALAAFAAAVLGAIAPSASAQASADNQVVLNPGTVIPVTLDTELSSSHDNSGDTFTAKVDDSRQAYSNILSGASVDGVVRQATPQQGNDPGTLRLAFTRLHLSDGRTIAISGSPTSLDSKDLTQRSDGVLIAKATQKNNTLTYAGIGAGAGVLVDVLTGGRLKLQDILIGGGLGAIAAQVLKGQSQVHDVDLQPGTPLGVRLNSSTRYYHRTVSGMTTVTDRTLNTGPDFGRGNGLAVNVNGDQIAFLGQGPVENDGRVLVPLRGVLEKLGAYVSYDSARREVHAVRSETEIVLPIGGSTAQVNGSPVALDAPARLLNGSTMVPLRFVAEALGANVNYEPSTRTVAIRTP